MGIFSKILDKLGLNKKAKEDEAAQAQALKDMAKKEAEARANLKAQADKAAASGAKPAAAPAPKAAVAQAPAQPGQTMKAAPVAISEVDVVKHLEELSAGKGLNWKVSIVDLLKLLDIDSSREARNELAEELGVPAELKSDSAKMNVWLHKAVLKKIAENGGNIPQSLLD
ncbi:MAG TPA: DUF3597 domain-containing protein [Anaerolineales bacterium]|jgi:uncharacterized protein DUF3597|nr:DUF3597 domain-containing protein [Anaerolineales bacterium]